MIQSRTDVRNQEKKGDLRKRETLRNPERRDVHRRRVRAEVQ
jgi:hypothetical protein